MSKRTYALERRGNVSQMYLARQGEITPEMLFVAEQERVDPAWVRDQLAAGKLVIPANIMHQNLEPMAVGLGTRCKVNANIGNSSVTSDIEKELFKLDTAIRYGADTVMDLSTGGDIPRIRQAIIDASSVAIGTVPIYEAVSKVEDVIDLTHADLLAVIQAQAEQGVDYMTIHCGILRRMLPDAKQRVTGIVSRGGSLMARWMQANDQENPFYTQYDAILEICKRYDVTLSLGDSLRPGCLADACDDAQYGELEVLGELCRRAWEHDVQVMIEGPGHVPMHLIAENVQRQQELCDGAPFYVLGPLVTDIGAGYDHITSAIGGAIAAWHGVSMLCYVTPKEHLGLPEADDVRTGIVAHKIAAHAADIARGLPGARDRDDAMARARFAFDWDEQFDLALDGDRAREYRKEHAPTSEDGDNVRYCSMCGPRYCSMKISRELWEGEVQEKVGDKAPCLHGAKASK
jgi:phosphomethylpyrimidine synthase